MERLPIVWLECARTENLTDLQRRFRDALVEHLDRSGLSVVRDWASTATVKQRLEYVRACHGVIVIAFSQWDARRLSRDKSKNAVFPSEFAHIGIALAVAAKRPLLVFREKEVEERGALRPGYVHPVISLPRSLDTDWLKSEKCERDLRAWRQQVQSARHVFLGYSSQAAAVGEKVHKYLTEKLKLRVFDWHEFRPGDAIWESIERAEQLTECGVFLFMADDALTSGRKRQVAPRDNVVYEAGYFAGAKGRSRSLIIREEGAKVPSDLGGILYLSLDNRKNIAAIETPLREHLERMLSNDSVFTRTSP
jgi:hypothetical protein